MMTFQPILHVMGLLTACLGALMVAPALTDFLAENPDWRVFALYAAVAVVSGLSFAIANHRPGEMRLSKRQAFLMTTSGWATVATISALPMLDRGWARRRAGGKLRIPSRCCKVGAASPC